MSVPPPVYTVPESWDKVDHIWLSSVLKRPISPNNLKLIPNAHVGSGYLSHVVRLSCVTDDGEQLNIIIKLMPAGAENSEELCGVIINEGLDIAEISFYEHVAPRLVAENSELASSFPRFLAGFIVHEPKRDSVIMMEDLKAKGYSTCNFAQIMPTFRVEEAVRFMSRFHHTVDVVVHKEQKELKEIWPFIRSGLCDDPVEKSSMFAFIVEGYSKLSEFFKAQGVEEDLWNYYKGLGTKSDEAFKTIMTIQSNYPTLLHNDLWSNNMLVPDSDSEPLKYIDWQTLGKGCPEMDIAVVIVSCLPGDQLTKANVERLVDLYLDAYYEYCDKQGLPELKARRPREDFKKFFFSYAMCFTFMWFTFASFPFETNFPRLIQIYRYLRDEVDVVKSFLSLIS